MKLVQFNLISGEDEDNLPTTSPVSINMDLIRSFRPRKHGEVGTRIEFANSAALIVKETYAEVHEAVTRTN